MKVKICGITSLEDALAACEAGADALGFNFVLEAVKRNRYISPEKAQSIIEQLPPFVHTVAVVANEKPERIAEYLEFLDYIQCHGEEPPEYCARFSSRLIKSFRLSPDFDVEYMIRFPACAYLLDAYVPNMLGGTGVACDWNKAREVARKAKCVILAGGLTEENVSQAVKEVQPFAVDVASGVEDAPGKKSYIKMKNFIRAAKGL